MNLSCGDRVVSPWGRGKVIGVEEEVVYILMDDLDDGEAGVEICLLSDIGERTEDGEERK